jgi:hypothetical protein
VRKRERKREREIERVSVGEGEERKHIELQEYTPFTGYLGMCV